MVSSARIYGVEWWADVLADPRARRQTRGGHSRGALNIYRLRDEPRAIILVACTDARRHIGVIWQRHAVLGPFEFELNLPDSGGGYAVHFSQILFRFASRNDRSNYLATETVTWISDVPVIRTIVPVT